VNVLGKAREAVEDAKQTVSLSAAVSVAALIISVVALIVAVVRA
jgi:hypothetical protein